MSTLQALLAFTLAAGLLTITPGLDTALVLRTGVVEGRRQAMLAALGIGLGCMVWGLAVGAGLGALLAASRLAYDVLRWAGGAYLLVLGLRMLLRPRRGLELGVAAQTAAPRTNWLVRGLLTNLLNPKIGVFYVSFLPQFIPAGGQVLAWSVGLTAIHCLLGLGWFAALLFAVRPLFDQLQRPAVLAWLDRVTGLLFVGFGLRLALSARG